METTKAAIPEGLVTTSEIRRRFEITNYSQFVLARARCGVKPYKRFGMGVVYTEADALKIGAEIARLGAPKP